MLSEFLRERTPFGYADGFGAAVFSYAGFMERIQSAGDPLQALPKHLAPLPERSAGQIFQHGHFHAACRFFGCDMHDRGHHFRWRGKGGAVDRHSN